MSRLLLPLAYFLAAMPGYAALSEDRQKDSPSPKPPTYQTPKEWKSVEAGQFLVARYQIGKGDRLASVTVAGLKGDGGGLSPNINRWRGQIGLEALSEKDAMKSLQPLKIDGLPGHMLDITGPEVAGKPTQRILVVVVKRGDHTWFFNLKGQATLVGEQKAAFDGFLKSVRFEK